MTRMFWARKTRRISMSAWALVFLLVGVSQFRAGHHPLVLLLFLLIAVMGFRIAWRRITTPLYTITDEELLISGVWLGRKRLRWRDVKELKEDERSVRLVGREWVGGTELSPQHLSDAERQSFLELVRDRVRLAVADGSGQPTDQDGV